MNDIGNNEHHNNLHPFLKDLGDKIAEQAPKKYAVSPQEAYKQEGNPRGSLMSLGGSCRGCADECVYYSPAGASEVRISGMCEPCFDFVMLHPDDREELDQWMTSVEYNKKD